MAILYNTLFQTNLKSLFFLPFYVHFFSGISRVSQPTIVFHILLRNGEFKTFEVPIVMFHRLRYTIACLLKEFQALEGRQILRK